MIQRLGYINYKVDIIMWIVAFTEELDVSKCVFRSNHASNYMY
jgi:hypothetical protein